MTDRLPIREFLAYLEQAVAHYEKSAPTVASYLDDLYIRMTSEPHKVILVELTQADQLHQDGHWQQPNHAANRIYKLLHRLGRSTEGMVGF